MVAVAVAARSVVPGVIVSLAGGGVDVVSVTAVVSVATVVVLTSAGSGAGLVSRAQPATPSTSSRVMIDLITFTPVRRGASGVP